MPVPSIESPTWFSWTRSKWPEVIPMLSTSTKATINALDYIFATRGQSKPHESDSIIQFTLIEFEEYFKNRAIKHSVFSLPSTIATCGYIEKIFSQKEIGEWDGRSDKEISRSKLGKHPFDAKWENIWRNVDGENCQIN